MFRTLGSETPLYMAYTGGFKQTFKIMLKRCRDPGYSGPKCRTVLHAAIERSDIESAILILKEQRHLYTIADENGWTAFHYAAHNNCGSIITHLLRKEGEFFGMSVGDVLTRRTSKTSSALHIAASQGHVSIVDKLLKFYKQRIQRLERDNLVNTSVEVDEEGQNIRQSMTAQGNRNGDNLTYITEEVDEEGQNILHIAAEKNHRELVLLILKYYQAIITPLLKVKDKNENTPLHLLVKSGCYVPELIKHEGADKKAKNKDNSTPYDMLYFSDDIVCDQLKIKDTFNDNSEYINQRWNFRLRRKKPLVNPEDNSLASTINSKTKDAQFDKARDLLIKKEVEVYRARINTQIIVTALITTVTFTVGFTMPGGYHQSGEEDEGSAVLSKKTAFKVFVLADTLALLLSMYSLALYFVASMYQDAKEISKLVDASTLLNIISVVATMLTFVMGIYLVLPHSSDIVLAVLVMCGVFVLLIILLIIKVMNDTTEKFRE